MKTILTTLVLIVSVLGQASVWRVNNNPNYVQGEGGPCGELDVCAHCFTNLQEAIDCSEVLPGDTLYVEASGISYGSINIDKALTLIGTGYLLPDNPGIHCNNLSSMVNRVNFLDGSSGSKISGLLVTINSSSSHGYIGFQGNLTGITVERCYTARSIGFYSASLTYNDIVIRGNIVMGDITESTNSSSAEDVYGLMLENNYVAGDINFNTDVSATGLVQHNTIGGNVYVNAGLEFMNNLCASVAITINENNNSLINIHHNSFAGSIPSFIIGGDNVAGIGQSTMLPDLDSTEPLEDHFVPGGGCTSCFTGSTSGGQMGAYGGLQPYIRAGIPGIPSISEKSNTTATYEGGTIEVVVSAKVNN